MKSKSMTRQEKRRIGILKMVGCIICKQSPCHAHHLLSGGVRRGHLYTIGLCSGHHTEGFMGTGTSYHGNKKLFHKLYGTDDELLAENNLLISAYERSIVR